MSLSVVEQDDDEEELLSFGDDPQQPLFTPVVLSILGTETAERFAYFGFRAILVLYFTNELYLEDNTAISWFAYTTCLANFSPLLGALLADGPLGRFRTILSFGSLYAVGLMILTFAAFFGTHDEEDAYQQAHGVEANLRQLFWKRLLTTVGLILVCIGTGGIKPCVNIFGADQVALRDHHGKEEEEAMIEEESHQEEDRIGRTATTQTNLADDDHEHAVRQFFNFFYFCINVGAVTSFALIPLVKRQYGFGMAFLLPTLCMMLALSLFYGMRHHYVYRPQQSASDTPTLANTFRLTFQLMRQKWSSNNGSHELLQQQSSQEEEHPQQHSQEVALAERTFEMHNQDSFGDDYFDDEPTTPPTSNRSIIQHDKNDMTWAQHQMALEDAHQALQILPIMALLPMFWMLYDQQGSVWTLQASRMDLHGLEPEQLSIVNPLEIMLFIPLFDRVLYPTLEQVHKIDMNPLRRMGWGMVLAALSFVVSGFLEHVMERSPVQSVSVFWMIPQITILAVGEIFLSVTGLEYAYSRSPDRLKGFLMATYLLMVALGDLMGGILYSSVFRHLDRAVAMYICAALMLLNRWVFGRVAAQQQQDTDVARTTSEEDGVVVPSDNPDDNPPTKDTVGRTDSDGSIEMIGKEEIEDSTAQPPFVATQDLLSGGLDDATPQTHDLLLVDQEDWLNLEMSNLRVV